MSRRDRFSDLGIELSPEFRSAFDEARADMDTWIDDKMDDLRDSMNTSLQTYEQQLKSEVQDVADDLAATHAEISAIMQKVDGFASSLEEGDGASLEEAIGRTQELVRRVKNELEAHERRWKKLGETGMAVAIRAAKTAVGLPV